MRRLTLAFVVALLALSASGISSLVLTEPCTASEPAGQTDSACPPTCVTCGCCAQAVEPVVFVAEFSPDAREKDVLPALPGIPKTDPRPILHVPRPPFA